MAGFEATDAATKFALVDKIPWERKVFALLRKGASTAIRLSGRRVHGTTSQHQEIIK